MASAILYVLAIILVLVNLVGLITSATAASRAGSTLTATTAWSPAVGASVVNAIGLLLGFGLVFMIYKSCPDIVEYA